MLKLSKLISFNLGGHFNHTFFWDNLSPIDKHGGVKPLDSSKLGQEINNTFGSLNNFIWEFNKRATSI